MCIVNAIKSGIVLNGRCCCQKLKSIYKKVILVFDLQKIIHHRCWSTFRHFSSSFVFWSLSLAVKLKEQIKNTKCVLVLLLNSREDILFSSRFIFVYFTCLIKYVFPRNRIILKDSDLIFSQKCEKNAITIFIVIRSKIFKLRFIVNKNTRWCSHGLGAFTLTLSNALFHWNAWNFIRMKRLNVLAKTLVEFKIQMKHSNQRKKKPS